MQNLVFLIKILISTSFSTSLLILLWILLLLNLAVFRSCCHQISSSSKTAQCWARTQSAAVTTWLLTDTHYFYTISINYHCCWSYSKSSSAKTDLYRFFTSQLLLRAAHSSQYITLVVVYFSLYISVLHFSSSILFFVDSWLKSVSERWKRRSSSHNIILVCWSVY